MDDDCVPAPDALAAQLDDHRARAGGARAHGRPRQRREHRHPGMVRRAAGARSRRAPSAFPTRLSSGGTRTRSTCSGASRVPGSASNGVPMQRVSVRRTASGRGQARVEVLLRGAQPGVLPARDATPALATGAALASRVGCAHGRAARSVGKLAVRAVFRERTQRGRKLAMVWPWSRRRRARPARAHGAGRRVRPAPRSRVAPMSSHERRAKQGAIMVMPRRRRRGSPGDRGVLDAGGRMGDGGAAPLRATHGS